MDFRHEKPFPMCFVHKSRNFSYFEPTFDYIMLRNFGTVWLIFTKIAPNLHKTWEKKVMKARSTKKKNPQNYRTKHLGGGFCPIPAFLGLNIGAMLCWREVKAISLRVTLLLTISNVIVHGLLEAIDDELQCGFSDINAPCQGAFACQGQTGAKQFINLF